MKTNVICEYANLLLGHIIEEPVKRMTTLGKMQNSREAQQNVQATINKCSTKSMLAF